MAGILSANRLKMFKCVVIFVLFASASGILSGNIELPFASLIRSLDAIKATSTSILKTVDEIVKDGEASEDAFGKLSKEIQQVSNHTLTVGSIAKTLRSIPVLVRFLRSLDNLVSEAISKIVLALTTIIPMLDRNSRSLVARIESLLLGFLDIFKQTSIVSDCSNMNSLANFQNILTATGHTFDKLKKYRHDSACSSSLLEDSTRIMTEVLELVRVFQSQLDEMSRKSPRCSRNQILQDLVKECQKQLSEVDQELVSRNCSKSCQWKNPEF